MEWDVFAAHASVDNPRVRPIVAALRGDGLRVFFDEDNIPVGEAWDVVLPAALRASRATVVFLSAAYEAAFYQRVEAHQALGRRRAGDHRVLVVWLDPPGPQPVLYGLDVVPAVELASGVDGVVEAVRRLLTDARWAMDWPTEGAPDPRALHEALMGLTNLSFEELIFGLRVERARLLPSTVEQSRRAINLIEHLNERGELDRLAARLRR